MITSFAASAADSSATRRRVSPRSWECCDGGWLPAVVPDRWSKVRRLVAVIKLSGRTHVGGSVRGNLSWPPN